MLYRYFSTFWSKFAFLSFWNAYSNVVLENFFLQMFVDSHTVGSPTPTHCVCKPVGRSVSPLPSFPSVRSLLFPRKKKFLMEKRQILLSSVRSFPAWSASGKKRSFQNLMQKSHENRSCTRGDENRERRNYLFIRENSRGGGNEWMEVDGILWASAGEERITHALREGGGGRKNVLAAHTNPPPPHPYCFITGNGRWWLNWHRLANQGKGSQKWECGFCLSSTNIPYIVTLCKRKENRSCTFPEKKKESDWAALSDMSNAVSYGKIGPGWEICIFRTRDFGTLTTPFLTNSGYSVSAYGSPSPQKILWHNPPRVCDGSTFPRTTTPHFPFLLLFYFLV